MPKKPYPKRFEANLGPALLLRHSHYISHTGSQSIYAQPEPAAKCSALEAGNLGRALESIKTRPDQIVSTLDQQIWLIHHCVPFSTIHLELLSPPKGSISSIYARRGPTSRWSRTRFSRAGLDLAPLERSLSRQNSTYITCARLRETCRIQL